MAWLVIGICGLLVFSQPIVAQEPAKEPSESGDSATPAAQPVEASGVETPVLDGGAAPVGATSQVSAGETTAPGEDAAGDDMAALAAEQDAGAVAAPLLMTRRLAEFMPRDEPIVLRGNASSHDLYLPVPDRWDLGWAELQLEFTNSIALQQNRSQLIVSLDGHVVSQTMLNPKSPRGSVTVALPVDRLAPGFVPLTFSVNQHYRTENECEDWAAPELWTQIDPTASTLRMAVTPRRPDPTLADVYALFDRKAWQSPELLVLTPQAPGTSELKAGYLVAAGAALRLDYVPLQVRHQIAQRRTQSLHPDLADSYRFPGLDQGPLAGRDAVLIGTRGDLAPMLAPELLERIDGAILAVFPQDENPEHVVWLVSGTTPEELERSAGALARLDFPLPDSAWTRVDAIDLPPLPPYTSRLAMREDQTYAFSDFGFQTTMLRGFGQDGGRADAVLEFAVPPDLFAGERASLELNLHLAFGAGMRSDSVLNIYLNDRFENAVALNEAGGAVFRDYRLAIPLQSLRPGINRLRFAGGMVPSVTGECQYVNQANLVLTLFEDSTLRLGPLDHYATLPDLGLFGHTGFPFLVQPYGEGVAVQLAGNDSQTIGAAWTLAARLTQVADHPLHGARFQFEPYADTGQVIVVGAHAEVDTALLGAAPLRLRAGSDDTHVFVQPNDMLYTADPEPLSLWQRLVHWLAPELPRDTPERIAAPVRLMQTGQLGRYAAMMQFQARGEQGAVVLVTADSPARLEDGVQALVRPAVWDGLRGDLVVWDGRKDSLRWQRVGETWSVGERTRVSWLRYLFSKYPLYMVATALVLLILFAWLSYYLLTRRRRRRLARGA